MAHDPHESIFHSSAGGLAADKRARRFSMIAFAMSLPSHPALRGGPPRGFPPATGPTWASSALLEAAARYAERAGAYLGGHADQADALDAGARSADANSVKEIYRAGGDLPFARYVFMARIILAVFLLPIEACERCRLPRLKGKQSH